MLKRNDFLPKNHLNQPWDCITMYLNNPLLLGISFIQPMTILYVEVNSPRRYHLNSSVGDAVWEMMSFV